MATIRKLKTNLTGTKSLGAVSRGSGLGETVSLCVGGQMFVTRRATLFRLPDSRLCMVATHSLSLVEGQTNSSNSLNATAPANLSANTPEVTTVGGASILPQYTTTNILGQNYNLVPGALVCKGGVVGVETSVSQALDSSGSYRSRTTSSAFLGNCSNSYGGVPAIPVNTQPVYFFDRDPEIFRFVLDFYRTGELHLPSSICGPFVRKELIFWGIDESFIGPCCMPAYMRYDEEKRTKNTLFKDCFEDIESMQNLVKYSRGLKKWRYRMWLFLDHPTSSLPAKMWASMLLVLMIASVMCYCLGTHENFRKTVHQKLNLTNNDSRVCSLSEITNPKFKKDCMSEPSPTLVRFDASLNVLFTLEFILKLVLAPDKQRFLNNIISIFDIIILASYWIYIIMLSFVYYAKDDQNAGPEHLWYMNMFSLTQSLRICRVFKISKISRGLRVLILTVKKSIPELVLLGFLLMNGMFMFSSMIYIAEYTQNDTFPDIPKAFWWSIVTLTTVGYGDMVPKSSGGYLVGSITAISGCILTGLAIPIIGNNFNTYYKYMKNQLKEDKYLKMLSREMQSSNTHIKQGLGHVAKGTGIGRKARLLKASRGINGIPKEPLLENTPKRNSIKPVFTEIKTPDSFVETVNPVFTTNVNNSKPSSRRCSQILDSNSDRRASIMPLSLDTNFSLLKVPLEISDCEEAESDNPSIEDSHGSRNFGVLPEEESKIQSLSELENDEEYCKMPSDIEEAARAAQEILMNGPIKLESRFRSPNKPVSNCVKNKITEDNTQEAKENYI